MLKSSLAFFLSTILLALGVGKAASCPVINGKYKMPVKIDGEDWIRTTTYYNTRQEGGVFSYTIDKEGNFHQADGVARPFRNKERYGKATLTCSGNTLVILTQEDGNEEVNRTELRALNNSQIIIDHAIKERSGLYTKE